MNMNKLNQWFHTHPYKACAFCASIAYLTGLVGAMFATETQCNHRWFLVGLISAIWIAWQVVMWIDCKKLVAVAVAASLFLGVPRANAAPALVIGVAVVVIIGGVVGCKVIKKCKKIARGRDNNLTNESPFVVAGQIPETGALFSWSESGTCYEERLLPTIPTVYTMCPYIDGTNIIVLTHADVGQQYVQTWQEFKAEMSGHGLYVPEIPGASACYELNGHPAEPQQVPITFDTATHTVTLGAGGIVLTIERSEDLKTWEPFLKINLPADAPLRIEDAGEGQAFYRFSARTP